MNAVQPGDLARPAQPSAPHPCLVLDLDAHSRLANRRHLLACFLGRMQAAAIRFLVRCRDFSPSRWLSKLFSVEGEKGRHLLLQSRPPRCRPRRARAGPHAVLYFFPSRFSFSWCAYILSCLKGCLYCQGSTEYDTNSIPPDYAATHYKVAQRNLATTNDLLSDLSNQRSALSVALANLDRHRTSKQGGVEAFELFASPLLSSQATLLALYQPCLDLVYKIKVHPALLSVPSSSLGGLSASSRRTASAASPSLTPDSTAPTLHHRSSSATHTSTTTTVKDRFLGDYVSREKIGQVKDVCAKVYGSSPRPPQLINREYSC